MHEAESPIQGWEKMPQERMNSTVPPSNQCFSGPDPSPLLQQQVCIPPPPRLAPLTLRGTTLHPWRKLKPSDENPESVSHSLSHPSHRGAPLCLPTEPTAHTPSLTDPSLCCRLNLSLFSGPSTQHTGRPTANKAGSIPGSLPISPHSQLLKLSLQAMSPSQPPPLLNSVQSGFSAS